SPGASRRRAAAAPDRPGAGCRSGSAAGRRADGGARRAGGPRGRRPAPRGPGSRGRRARRLPGLRPGRGAGGADPGPGAGAAGTRHRVRFLVASAYRDLRRTGLAGATAVLLAALAVLAAGATVAGRQALARLTAGWRAEVRIVALLREDPGGAGGKSGVVSDVQALPGVAAVRYVSSR